MSANLTKDIIVLLAGVVLTLGLESQRAVLEHRFGPEWTSLFCFLIFVVLLSGYLAFRHYIAPLTSGAKSEAPHPRHAYDDLRKTLSPGGTPALTYARWLERALHAV